MPIPAPVSLIEDIAFDISDGFKFGSPKPGVSFMLTMVHLFNSSLIANIYSIFRPRKVHSPISIDGR